MFHSSPAKGRRKLPPRFQCQGMAKYPLIWWWGSCLSLPTNAIPAFGPCYLSFPIGECCPSSGCPLAPPLSWDRNSVCPSVCHTHALWRLTKRKNVLPMFWCHMKTARVVIPVFWYQQKLVGPAFQPGMFPGAPTPPKNLFIRRWAFVLLHEQDMQSSARATDRQSPKPANVGNSRRTSNPQPRATGWSRVRCMCGT